MSPSSRLWIVSLALAATFPAGCSTDDSAPDADDHHLEHHHADHRPESFAAAVGAIRTRLTALEGGSASARGPAFDRQIDELRDVIEWLPELAADSDLGRPQWEEVHRVSRRLAERAAEELTADAAATSRRVAADFEEDLASLDRLAEAASAEPEPGAAQ